MSEQKIILITGTSSGFGFMASQQLAEKGHIIYASMRGIDEKNKKAAAALAESYKNIHIVEMDISNKDQVDGVVDQIISEQGRIDVAINNAGVMNVGVAEAYTAEQHYTQMEANYFGPVRIFRAVLPHMRAIKSGLILTVTSLAGRLVFPAFTTYNASKFAAEALAEGYRYELAPFGVDSVILEPGPFDTQLISNSPKPLDTQTVKAYGEHGARLNNVLAGFEDFYEQESNGLANPQILVDDMIKLIETPYGERPLRTVSGVDYGTRQLNDVSAPIQSEVLESMEMTDLDHFSASTSKTAGE
jgi:NAD(P)-dependent dehydrogenase (short-subunit alcohol dehydrogenase family)